MIIMAYVINQVKDRWILKRDKYGMYRDILCNGHSIVISKLNIEYPIESIPILHLDIPLINFDFENI